MYTKTHAKCIENPCMVYTKTHAKCIENPCLVYRKNHAVNMDFRDSRVFRGRPIGSDWRVPRSQMGSKSGQLGFKKGPKGSKMPILGGTPECSKTLLITCFFLIPGSIFSIFWTPKWGLEPCLTGRFGTLFGGVSKPGFTVWQGAKMARLDPFWGGSDPPFGGGSPIQLGGGQNTPQKGSKPVSGGGPKNPCAAEHC